jgi:hypothetical protein
MYLKSFGVLEVSKARNKSLSAELKMALYGEARGFFGPSSIGGSTSTEALTLAFTPLLF